MGDLMREKGADPSSWVWVSSEDSVFDAVNRMARAKIGSLLVFDPERLRSEIPWRKVGADDVASGPGGRPGTSPTPGTGGRSSPMPTSGDPSARLSHLASPPADDRRVGAAASSSSRAGSFSTSANASSLIGDEIPDGTGAGLAGRGVIPGDRDLASPRCDVRGPSRLAAAAEVGLAPLASKDAVVGIITERDYLTKVVVQGRRSSHTSVGEVMTPAARIVSATPQHSVLDVMELMIARGFRHVPVVDGAHLLGMASMRDVVAIMLREHREEVGRLHEYIQGTL